MTHVSSDGRLSQFNHNVSSFFNLSQIVLKIDDLSLDLWDEMKTGITQRYQLTLHNQLYMFLWYPVKKSSHNWYLFALPYSKDVSESIVFHELNNAIQIFFNQNLMNRTHTFQLDLIEKYLDSIAIRSHQNHIFDLDPSTFRTLSLHEMLLNIMTYLKNQQDLKNIEYITHLEECQVLADETALIQIILNLLNNAIEAIQYTGKIVISCQKQASFVELKIEDDGPGIQSDQLSQVFKSGFSTKENGSGRGLYIVQKLLNLMGGNIQIQNTLSSGAQIVVQLSTPKETSHLFHEKSILLVEDDDMQRDLLNDYFSDLKMKVQSCSSFQKAFHYMDMDWDYSIIDVSLKDGSGEVLAHQLIEKQKSKKVFLMTGNHSYQFNDHRLSNQCEIISKPFLFDDLLHKMVTTH